MRNFASAFAFLLLVACSSNGTSPISPQVTHAAALTASSPGLNFAVYGSPNAFKQTGRENGIAFDGQGGVWISSGTALEHRAGSSAYVINDGFNPTSAYDDSHSIRCLTSLAGNVFGIGFDGVNTAAIVRVTSDGSRSAHVLQGLSSAVNDWISVATGDNALYAIVLDTAGATKLLRISPSGIVLNETVLQQQANNTVFTEIAVSPTGDSYVVEQNGSFGVQINHYSATGSLKGNISYTDLPNDNRTCASGITTGPDGKIYIPGESQNLKEQGISVIDPSDNGEVFHPVPVGTQGNDPRNPVVGSDGNIWFVDYFANTLDRLTTTGTLTTAPEPLPYPDQVASAPKNATENPANSVWFTSFTDYWDSVRATF